MSTFHQKRLDSPMVGNNGSRKWLTSLVTMVALVAPSVALVGLTAPAQATGNNGTIKIHEEGTPVGTEDNDPKVCSFNIESYNLDAGQDGYIVFDVQGGDGPTGTSAGPYDFGPADSNGFFETEYYSLDDGHYKATLYGKFGSDGGINYDDIKAKSKVFKVECPPAPAPDDKVEYSEWKDASKDCATKTVTQTRTKTVTTYEWVDGKWVAQTPVVTTETQTRPMTPAEVEACGTTTTPPPPNCQTHPGMPGCVVTPPPVVTPPVTDACSGTNMPGSQPVGTVCTTDTIPTTVVYTKNVGKIVGWCVTEQRGKALAKGRVTTKKATRVTIKQGGKVLKTRVVAAGYKFRLKAPVTVGANVMLYMGGKFVDKDRVENDCFTPHIGLKTSASKG